MPVTTVYRKLRILQVSSTPLVWPGFQNNSGLSVFTTWISLCWSYDCMLKVLNEIKCFKFPFQIITVILHFKQTALSFFVEFVSDMHHV
jgi:hypothetical protein